MGGRRTHLALAALALLLAALLAALLLAPLTRESTGAGDAAMLPDGDGTPEMITDINVGTLAALALVNRSGSIAMMVQDGELEMIDAPGQMSASAMMALLYRLAHMPAAQNLGEVSDWAPYGLEDYEAAAVLLDLSGDRVRLFLGDAAPFDAGWYLRREGDDHLYLVDEITARMMRRTVDDLRDLQLFPSLPSERFSELTRVRLDRPDGVLEVRGAQQGGAVVFALAQPFEAALSWQLVVSELAAPIASLRAQRVVNEDGELARYGLLGDAAITLTVEAGGERTTLLFAPADEETFYCANAAQGTVVTVRREDASFLSCDAFSLMEDTLYPRRVADVDSVSIASADVRATLLISGQGTMLRGAIEGRELGQAQTVALYRALTLLPPAQPLGEGDALTGQPLLTLSISLKDGEVDVVELLSVSDRRYAVVINGEASFATYTAAVQEIIRAARQALGS